MLTLRHFIRIIDFQTLAVTFLALLSTWLCRRMGFGGDMPSGLIGVAIVFPIVFSINAAYRRRETALGLLSDLKAHALALYYIHRDWARPTENGAQKEHQAGFRRLARELFEALKTCFRAKGEMAEESRAQIYGLFSRFSSSFEVLRREGMSAGEVSRANQYLRAMIIDFEKMLNILYYRTPLALRAYSRVFLNIFPIVFGPYFAYLGDKSHPAVGYGVAVAYSLVLVSLDNIQEGLENPFDGIGAEDVRLDDLERYGEIMGD